MEVSYDGCLTDEDIKRFGNDPAARFRENLQELQERILVCAQSNSRQLQEVRLLPVTKTVPGHILRFGFAAGIRAFGENKIQEALQKQDILSDLDIDWTVIGHLQSNKAKHLIRFASEFHALDSLKLAHELNRRLTASNRALKVYIQVNTSGEPSKYGLQPDELLPFLERLHEYPQLKPQGLMTLAVFDPDRVRVRECFRRLRLLRDNAISIHKEIKGLSMGMSGDFEIAIAEGATVVRIGQAIFGTRPSGAAVYWPGYVGSPS
ncbi:YggS family pyridoxal phosphate-dependent enzyme [Brucella sp. NBRC 12950]|uniref:YggS family pyridoxal phosphate-dependent enzyme n=1 Tax=Brucella sp. NBRC 12950 TaxID=2994518 RepID=UPI0024A345F9|nr:YggS family pyridoxal phosphate-dependent enzyme [Brucella sp. NBRC 12950]GLU29332.1 YggS family pyridoxal phosphate enzyme [Brucella sp. NBRC 12950]